MAWQHIHFQGRLVFAKNPAINLDEIISSINLAVSQ